MKFIAILVSTFATIAFAGNGSNLIGVTAASQAMGGTGVGYSQNVSDALYKNPANLMLFKSETLNKHLNIDAVALDNNTTANGGLGDKVSSAKIKFTPEIGFAYTPNDFWAIGIGVFPYAGANTNFTGQAELSQVMIDSYVIRVVPTAAFQVAENTSIGFAPIIAGGELQLNEAALGTQTTRAPHGDIGFAFQAGIHQKLDKLNLGFTYISRLKLEHQAIVNFDSFGPLALTEFTVDDVFLQYPEEFALGAHYDFTDALSAILEYRLITWRNSDLFRELGWNNQHVIALGAQYKLDKLKLRLGINYGKPPIDDVSGENGTATVNIQGHSVFASSVSLLNVVAFPPTAMTHLTMGGSYQFTEGLSTDLAFMLAPETTRTHSGTGVLGAYSYTSKLSQWSIATGLRYQF